MNEKYLSIDLNDPRTAKIAEIMTNKTCKKILEFIAEKEMSESDIANALGIPLNTVGYNIKKLKEAGLIEPAKDLWSVKGKKIYFYKIANKKIVISPKSMIRGIIPAIFISGILALGIKLMTDSQIKLTNTAGEAANQAELLIPDRITNTVSEAASNAQSAYCMLASAGCEWLWFLLGALVALFIFLVWNWRKIWK